MLNRGRKAGVRICRRDAPTAGERRLEVAILDQVRTGFSDSSRDEGKIVQINVSGGAKVE
jgi:hypothetical protein